MRKFNDTYSIAYKYINNSKTVLLKQLRHIGLDDYQAHAELFRAWTAISHELGMELDRYKRVRDENASFCDKLKRYDDNQMPHTRLP